MALNITSSAKTADDRVVSLVKHPPQKYGAPDYFDRGERMIFVNNIRWGRTHVQSHGVHGTSTTFEQDTDGEGCGYIIVDPAIEVKSAYTRNEITVRSVTKRYMRRGEVWQPTEQLVLAKAVELVEKGLLRESATVKEELIQRAATYNKRREAAQERENAAFLSKAKEALGTPDEDPTIIVARIVEAMRWAQDR